MTILKPREKPAAVNPSLLYVCDVPLSGPFGTATRDMQLRGDDPRVSNYPGLWSLAGTPLNERGSDWKLFLDRREAEEARLAAERAAEHARQAKGNRLRLEAPVPPAVLRCVRDVETDRDGRPAIVVRGSTVLAGDEVALAFPDSFEQVST